MQITIENSRQNETLGFDSSRPIEIGRLSDVMDPSAHQITVLDEFVSRKHLRIEILDVRTFLVRNLSSSLDVVFADGTRLAPAESHRVSHSSIRLLIGHTRVSLDAQASQQCFLTLSSPQALDDSGVSIRDVIAPTIEDLTRWFETVLSIQRAAAGTQEFYLEAASAIVSLIGFDQGVVLEYTDECWRLLGSFPESAEPTYSTRILNAAAAQRRTLYEGGQDDASASLANISLAAASPMLSDTNEVIGAIYGSRSRIEFESVNSISRLEAQLLQVIASAVAAGIARRMKEVDAARQQLRFEQFFSPVLSRELEKDPDLLVGREREVTVLFCDIREFSSISTRLTPKDTCQLISDVMEALTPPVLRNEGVVVDYIGDQLIAMWNAPNDVEDHAVLACRAALQMVAALESVQEIWRPVVGHDVRVGIGISSGPALVGNTGCRYRFKYGALGHTLNATSRIEGATKQLGVGILIAGSTKALIKGHFCTRRIANVRVVGICEPIQVFELFPADGDSNRTELIACYEDALAALEGGNFQRCYQLLQPIMQKETIDYPSLILSSRALEYIRSPKGFTPILELQTK